MELQQGSGSLPIGIFDSGVGGLTVMKEIERELPAEDIIYLGDTARVPYGIRSPETVTKYSLQNAQFLASKGIKLLIVACNTSSAISLDLLSENLPIPVVGVVRPGAKAAVSRTKAKKVAVIGTETTIKSRSYKKAIGELDDSIDVTGVACPLFVPLIEEGWLDGEIATLVAERYLSSLGDSGADTLVLGCTHYPMIKDVITGIINIPLVDSAIETALETRRILQEGGLLNLQEGGGRKDFFVTDAPEKFSETGKRFLGHKIMNITKIELGA
jgi:glutamate racemase